MVLVQAVTYKEEVFDAFAASYFEGCASLKFLQDSGKALICPLGLLLE
jgi:hypothetical protein